MKYLLVVVSFMFSMCVFSMEDNKEIFYNIFNKNLNGNIQEAKDKCSSGEIVSSYCDYLLFTDNDETDVKYQKNHFNPVYRIQGEDYYDEDNHSVAYLPVRTLGSIFLAKLDTATSTVVLNITGDIYESPFKSPFSEDLGGNFGIYSGNLEGETFSIEGKNIYTTNSSNNIVGQDLIEMLGGIEISLVGVKFDPEIPDCNDRCKLFDIKKKNLKWYITLDNDSDGLDLVLDTGSEISTLSNVTQSSCSKVKGNPEVKGLFSIKDKLKVCSLIMMNKKFYFYNGLSGYNEFDGTLGADFFNKYKKVIFDTKKWQIMFFD